MTSIEFRSSNDFLKEAAKIKSINAFRQMMEIMMTEHVMYGTGQPFGIAENDKTLFLGMIQGYNAYHKKLMSLFEPLPTPVRMPEEKYLPPQ